MRREKKNQNKLKYKHYNVLILEGEVFGFVFFQKKIAPAPIYLRRQF